MSVEVNENEKKEIDETLEKVEKSDEVEKITFTPQQQAKIEEIKAQEIGKAKEDALREFYESKGISAEDIDNLLLEKEKSKTDLQKKDEELAKLAKENAEFKSKEQERQFNKSLKPMLEDSKDVERTTKLLKSYYGLNSETSEEDVKNAITAMKEEFPELFNLVPDKTSGVEKKNEEDKGDKKHWMFGSRQ